MEEREGAHARPYQRFQQGAHQTTVQLAGENLVLRLGPEMGDAPPVIGLEV